MPLRDIFKIYLENMKKICQLKNKEKGIQKFGDICLRFYEMENLEFPVRLRNKMEEKLKEYLNYDEINKTSEAFQKEMDQFYSKVYDKCLSKFDFKEEDELVERIDVINREFNQCQTAEER